MKEIVKKILELVGNQDTIVVGEEEIEGIKTIKPEEIELYPKKFKNIIVENFEELSENEIKKLAEMADCLWALFSMDKFIQGVDTTIEEMMRNNEIRNVSMNEKMEIFKNMVGKRAFIADFNLPELAIAVTRKEMEIPKNIKFEPFSQFFLNLSMVEYLKSKIEELRGEKEKLKTELEMEKIKFNSETEKLERIKEEKERLQEEIERIRKEKEELRKQMEIERKNMEKRFREDLVRNFRERARLQEELERMKEEKERLQEEIERIMKEKEEYYKKELEKITLEMGLKLEEKEEELKRLRKERQL